MLTTNGVVHARKGLLQGTRVFLPHKVCSNEPRANDRGEEVMKIDSHEGFRQLSSTIKTRAKRELGVGQTVIDTHENFEHIQSQ